MHRPMKRTLQPRDAPIDPLACLSKPFTESLTKADEDLEAITPSVQGKHAGAAPIEGYRLPHTLTTVSWADGCVSRGFVTARSDCLSESQRTKANEASLCQKMG